MKKTYIRRLVVACVATMTLTWPQQQKAEAITELEPINKDIFLEIGYQLGTSLFESKQINNDILDLLEVKDIMKIPDTFSLFPTQTLEETMQVPESNETKSEDSIRSNYDINLEMEEQIQLNEPVTEVPEILPEQVEPAITLSNEEKDLFARLVEAEAKGESYEGKVAVATVVLNRVESPEFPDTVTEVIHEVVGKAYAFTPVQNGKINNPASDEAKQAVDEALTRNDRLQDTIYFYNPEIATDDWIRSREVVATIGNHVFAK